jgi:hypothetical protein
MAFDRVKRAATQYVFDRFMAWRIEELMAPTSIVKLDYGVEPSPRYGYGKPPHPQLDALIGARADAYAARIESFLDFADLVSAIARESEASDAAEPTFRNTYFSGLDAIAYYAIVAKEKPKTIFEIGSGYSTKFARRAIRDHGLATRIVTCDPQPRTEIDSISDEIIRVPFEKLDLSRLDDLGQNDILFIDSSHRSFTNSDVTVQFLDALPRLRPGVLVHQHDIMLPYDYPPSWSDRYYSEQYLLATYLLGGSSGLEIFCPNAYLSLAPSFVGKLEPIWQGPDMDAVRKFSAALYQGYLGFSFWTRTVARG